MEICCRVALLGLTWADQCADLPSAAATYEAYPRFVMKDRWVIAYDLNVKAMKANGYSKSQVTKYYNDLRECLSTFGFNKFTQNSIYATEHPDAIVRAFQIVTCINNRKDPQYVNRLHMFKVEDFNDLRPLLPDYTVEDDIDAIMERIEEAFEGEDPSEEASAETEAYRAS